MRSGLEGLTDTDDNVTVGAVIASMTGPAVLVVPFKVALTANETDPGLPPAVNVAVPEPVGERVPRAVGVTDH